jgi:hypothetical protein
VTCFKNFGWADGGATLRRSIEHTVRYTDPLRPFRAIMRSGTDAARYSLSDTLSLTKLALEPLYPPYFIDLSAPWSINLYGVVFGFSNQRASDR